MSDIFSLLAATIPNTFDDQILPLTIAAFEEDGTIAIPEFVVPMWPESISISASADYADKAPLGGSGTIKQWSATPSRSISMSLLLARDARPLRAASEDLTDILPDGSKFKLQRIDPQGPEFRSLNPDIRQILDKLQALTLPDYTNATSESALATVKPPPMVAVHAPGMAWAYNADDRDILYGFVQSLTINYVRSFSIGGPRMVTVDLTISESVQRPGSGVRFFSRSDLRTQPWWERADG